MPTWTYAPGARWLRSLSSVDMLHLVVLAVLIGLSPLVLARGVAAWWLPAGYLAMAATVLAFARWEGARPTSRAARGFHFWYPVLGVPLVFWSLVFVNRAVNDRLLGDAAMIAWDRRILGFELTTWLEGWEHPILTDVLHVFYLVYFLMPVALLLWIKARAPREALTEAVFVMCLAFFLCYVGYVAVPVAGPRHHVYHSNEMHGWLLTQPLRDAIDALEPNKADAFPSAHASITLVVAGLAVRQSRRFLPWVAALTAGILVSLVYGRYHYLVDVLAGVVWAAVSLIGGIWLHGAWERFRAKADAPRSADAVSPS